jgi:hypothetical protein
MTNPTLSPELQTSLDELSAAITTLRAQHDRALDTLNTLRVILKVPMEPRLVVSAAKTALDLYDRPMEQPDDLIPCPTCGKMVEEVHLRYEEGGGRSEPRWTDYGCVHCLTGRNVKPLPQDGEPQSQAERDGDA